MTAREAMIVGVCDLPLKDGVSAIPMSPLQMQAWTAKRALAEAGLTLSDVDGLLTAGMWGVPGAGQLPTITLSEYLGIVPRYSDATNIGGAAFVSHLARAKLAIEAGLCEVALITYGSAQRSEASRNLAGRPPALTMQYETPHGLPTPIGGYAMAARRHMHEFGSTSEQLAEVAVATRKWAMLNPAATKRDPLSIDDVLSSTMIADPLHVLDACLVTDGGGAIVMTTRRNAEAQRVPAVAVLGHGEAVSQWTITAMPDLARLTTAEISGARAFAMAGVRPEDVDLVQIYDAFTISVIMALEALGFCKAGEGGDFVTGQRTAPGGSFALNTSGGGLSYCHPGMFGLFLVTEAVRQLRGQCGERQVAGAATALVHGIGGTLSSGATCVLARA